MEFFFYCLLKCILFSWNRTVFNGIFIWEWRFSRNLYEEINDHRTMGLSINCVMQKIWKIWSLYRSWCNLYSFACVTITLFCMACKTLQMLSRKGKGSKKQPLLLVCNKIIIYDIHLNQLFANLKFKIRPTLSRRLFKDFFKNIQRDIYISLRIYHRIPN